MNQTLLVEILTEELPPKALMKLADSFASTIESSLKQEDFLNDTSKTTIYATPRRLAVTITDVRDVSPDKTVRQKVLPVNVALDADGNPTAPLKKKLAALNIPDIDISKLEKRRTAKTKVSSIPTRQPDCHWQVPCKKRLKRRPMTCLYRK